MNKVPGFAPDTAPVAPNSDSSTCGASGTIVITTSLLAATPAGEPPSFAPSAISRSRGARLRCAHTVTENPALISDAAIGSPIAPMPIRPILRDTSGAYGAQGLASCAAQRQNHAIALGVHPAFASEVLGRKLCGLRAWRGHRVIRRNRANAYALSRRTATGN